MTPDRTIHLLRALFVAFACAIGSTVSAALEDSPWVGASFGTSFGLAIVLLDLTLRGITLRTFSSATVGLLVGFVFTRLLLASNILMGASSTTAWVVTLVTYATFGYIGMMLAIRANRDEFALLIPYVRFRRTDVQERPLVLDSNIIIDGRLPELCATGFVSRSLVVPRFVLDEIQRLADSGDPLKRERGRTALDRLAQLQRMPDLSVTIHESQRDTTTAVDTQLVALAKALDARLLTNDTNLCSIARLQSVPTLNLNDLTKAVRPALDPGQTLDLALSKEGREAHQGVGYLADGTMIVVNHARAHLGKTVQVTISSVLQTSAGRLFFAEVKLHRDKTPVAIPFPAVHDEPASPTAGTAR